MAARKGPVYEEKWKIVNSELLGQLNEAFVELENQMKATVPINRNTVSGSRTIGYGVSKTQRGIAADRVISIARAIKALKGW